MNLYHALRLTHRDEVAFVGAGGKTTAMFCLANEIVESGGRVITTTTTRLGLDQLSLAPVHVTTIEELQVALQTSPHVLLTGEIDRTQPKLLGVSQSLISNLQSLTSNIQLPTSILVEADGSKQLPFKAPADHEPVIPDFVTHVVVVVGIDAVGKPLTAEYVHRPEIIAGLAESRVGTIINSEIIAKVLTHPQGGMKNVPSNVRVSVLINKVESDEQLKSAREIADQTLRDLKTLRVLIGAANQNDPVKEVWSHVTCAVLAAGESKRMGSPKQLLKWKDKTMLGHIVDVALGSESSEVMVIVGAEAEKVRQVIPPHARTVFNARYQAGQSESVKAAVAASPDSDAIIFLLTDQPNITPQVINALIQKWRETLAPIVCARVNGRRANPVLFDRSVWHELNELTGDTGGRAIFDRHEMVYMDWDDSILGEADTPGDYEKLKNEQ
jgi:molybdenum cofactor cytidylyltransferase